MCKVQTMEKKLNMGEIHENVLQTRKMPFMNRKSTEINTYKNGGKQKRKSIQKPMFFYKHPRKTNTKLSHIASFVFR